MEVILGGTHGLGWDLAFQLRESGKDVLVIGRSYMREKHGEGMRADLSNIEDTKRVIDMISGLGSASLDGFFWTIGIGFNGDFAEQSNVLEQVNTNLTHPMLVAQAAWKKQLSQNTPAHLVVVSSTTGIKIRDNETTYATTKGAQVSFARNLGKEIVRLGASVRISLFEPGGMKSPFWGSPEDRPAGYDERFMNTHDVAAYMLETIYHQDESFLEKMVEKPELDDWLKNVAN